VRPIQHNHGCVQRTGASMYPQSTTPAAPALPPDPPPLMTSSSTESVSATVPPDMVRSHVASMNAESTQMTLLAMCTPA